MSLQYKSCATAKLYPDPPTTLSDSIASNKSLKMELNLEPDFKWIPFTLHLRTSTLKKYLYTITFTHINFEKKPYTIKFTHINFEKKNPYTLRLSTSLLKKIRITSCFRFCTLVRKRSVYGLRIRIPVYGADAPNTLRTETRKKTMKN